MEEKETEHPLPTPPQSSLVSKCLSSRGQIGAAIVGMRLEAFDQCFLPPDSEFLGGDLAAPIEKKPRPPQGGTGRTETWAYLYQSHLALNIGDTYFKWSHLPLSLSHSNNREWDKLPCSRREGSEMWSFFFFFLIN